MSSPSAPDIVTRTGPAVRQAVVPAPRPHHLHDPWLRIAPGGAVTLPPAGQPGHGGTAFVRRQPVRIADGRFEGGYTGLFELICPGCGDHPYLDYSEIPPRLQWLRGPRTLKAALVAYDKHLGPLPGLNGDSAGSLGPHAATKVTRYAAAAGPASGCGQRRAGDSQARQGGIAHRRSACSAVTTGVSATHDADNAVDDEEDTDRSGHDRKDRRAGPY